mmetsp:Transcript_23598/g.55994  ORF Transcript_23598/g.55994 Transcript_23598/m.55994 type:complete len:223 (+) Transcript_23598:556-1224(+)
MSRVDNFRCSSFSLSACLSCSARFSRSFCCSSRALASASSLLILGFGGGGFSRGRSMSASSACSVSQLMAYSKPALSVLYRAFSARTSEKPISKTCCSKSCLTFSLISGGLGSPTLRSSTTGVMSTSSSPVMATSPPPKDARASSTKSSGSLSRSGPLFSAIQASAASMVPLSRVKCRALADRFFPRFFAETISANFFASTEAKNFSLRPAAASFFFWSSMR